MAGAVVALVMAAPMGLAYGNCGTSQAYIGSSSCTSGCEYIVFDAPGAILWEETNGFEAPQVAYDSHIWCTMGTDTAIAFL